MRVHFLGCGDAFGSGGRNHSAYLIESGQQAFLLDCGPTTLLAMKRAGFDPCSVNAVVLSHLHGDHFGGLPFLFLHYLYEQPRNAPLLIGGPRGTEDRVRTLTECMYPGGTGPRTLPPTLFQVLEPGKQQSIGGIDVLPFAVPHQPQQICLGLKVHVGGKRILYSGDSAWTDLFVTHGRNVDLFICECTFFDTEDPSHMTFRQVSDKLNLLESKRTVLTHMSREMLDRKSTIPFETADDGMVVEI